MYLLLLIKESPERISTSIASSIFPLFRNNPERFSNAINYIYNK